MLDFILDIPIIFIIAFLAIVAICVGAFLRSKDEKNGEKNDDIITSSDLHEQMNRENEKEGKTTIPAINATMGTSTNNLARRDKSWSSVPDFFRQLIRGRRD